MRGFRSMELDLQVTRDGQVVLMHDVTIDRTTTGAGAVKSMTLAEIHAADMEGAPGAKAPTWADFLQWAAGHDDVRLYVETKDYRTQADIGRMLDMAKTAGVADRIVWNSFRIHRIVSDIDLPSGAADSGWIFS